MYLSIKTYNQAISFIESLSNISQGHKRQSKAAGKRRLKQIRNFLAFLGNPEKNLKIIHIAGTSGKGSVVAMLHNILQAEGYNIGSYTSPHTTTFCERIKVRDKYISEKDLVELTNFLKNKMDEFVMYRNKKAKKHRNKKSPPPPFSKGGESGTSLNFFEFTFCLALLYFKKMKCKYAVVETGMGGRFDSTNAIQKPIYTIITNIGRDHLDIIGPTLKDVAYEKAGIIKVGAKFLTGEANKRFITIFARELKKITNYELRITSYKDLKNIKTDLEGTEFEYKNEQYKLRLPGKHQAGNAALAIECAEGLKISKPTIKRGLVAAFYPARLEVISKKPLIIIDGAHNADKLCAALNFLNANRYMLNAKKYLILAMAKNKETKKIIPEFAEYFDKINLTRFSNPFRKCYSFSDWLKIIPPRARKKINFFHLANDALFDILPKLRNNDLLLITGSIFLAGELRKHWHPENKIIKFRNSTKR